MDDKLSGNLGEVLIRCNNVLYLRGANSDESSMQVDKEKSSNRDKDSKDKEKERDRERDKKRQRNE